MQFFQTQKIFRLIANNDQYPIKSFAHNQMQMFGAMIYLSRLQNISFFLHVDEWQSPRTWGPINSNFCVHRLLPSSSIFFYGQNSTKRSDADAAAADHQKRAQQQNSIEQMIITTPTLRSYSSSQEFWKLFMLFDYAFKKCLFSFFFFWHLKIDTTVEFFV